MYYDSQARLDGSGRGGLPYNPFKALVAPRPIGWVSSLTEDGLVNLAPYSYFQAVADQPDIVMFSASPARPSSDRKDTERNVLGHGEFVCNIVPNSLAEAMNQTSASLPRDLSEAEFAGLELAPSERVAPPRVAAAPAALECALVETRPVRHRGGEHHYTMVFGEVLGIYIDDQYINHDNGRVDTAAMNILTRMGYDEYAVLERSYSMTRPDFDPMNSDVLKG